MGLPPRILKWERKIRIRGSEAVSTCIRKDKHKDQKIQIYFFSRKYQTTEKIQSSLTPKEQQKNQTLQQIVVIINIIKVSP